MSARRRHRRELAQLRAGGWTVVTFRPWQRSRPIPLPAAESTSARGARAERRWPAGPGSADRTAA
jgi:hypothetical protein